MIPKLRFFPSLEILGENETFQFTSGVNLDNVLGMAIAHSV
ncbi:MAG: hypothetical protein RMY28_028600 [Nostoc sp. ChiSLP01]|nr:hypothetical protein [Nostoc sp. CmiSLP01]MDZ8284151.1 hypothetical protein [Nostoc sp. ChiSLP01]